ncbi:helix-turn-helix domain-containing protein [Sphaerisporangium sp. NPDC049003]|uniref:helix-turn-helix domain-containing protein n=1 Tax=Sphaerisporangium sp. NPDC049003 TaxID=3364517 RepID=UPI003721E8F9
MPPETSPTVRRRRLASELRRLRVERGMSMQEVAERIEITAASLSRLETGRRGIRPRDLRFFLDLYEVGEPEREDLLTLAREAQQRGWWQNYSNLLPSEYATLIGLEAEAATIRNYTQTLVPGLLQTEAYARAIIEAFRPNDSPDEISRLVTVRMERQKRLTGDRPLELSVVLGEGVIRQHVGTPEITAEQLRRLADRRPNVMVQVLPYRAGAHPALTGSFSIVGFPASSDLDVVYLENMSSALYLEEADDVRKYGMVSDYLRAAALSPNDSADMLLEAADRLT